MIHELFRIFNWMGSEWVLMVLIALSVVSVWIMIQRYFEIRRLSAVSARLWAEHVDAWFNTGDAASWEGQLDQLRLNYPCLESDTLDLIYRAQRQPGVETDRMVAAYLESRRLKLEKYVGVLGTIGANAPFIGLLGTVLGIIRAFHDISLQGVGGGMENISGGIAEALVATAIGLIVAVPAVIAFNFLSKKITILVRRAQSVSALALSRKPNHDHQ